MGPRAEPHDVIFGWANDGGWSKGVSAMIGLPFMFGILYVSPYPDLASIVSRFPDLGFQQGFDCSVHLIEEVQDASLTIPPTIIWGMWSNAILMLALGVTVIFTIGDIPKVLVTPTDQPFIQIFLNTTGSYGATNTITAMICTTLVAACFSEVATASRQIWSFARDGGTFIVFSTS